MTGCKHGHDIENYSCTLCIEEKELFDLRAENKMLGFMVKEFTKTGCLSEANTAPNCLSVDHSERYDDLPCVACARVKRVQEALMPLVRWFEEQNASGHLSDGEYDLLVEARKGLDL